MTYRFVGGTQHGKQIAVPYDMHYFRVAIQEWAGTLAYWNRMDNPSACIPGPKIETYERRPVGFGMFASVYVMALSGMSEAQFMRRVADIVEGV